MSSRYFSELQKLAAPKSTPAPGQAGEAGAEAAKQKVSERTANWPTPGPLGKAAFNRKMKSPKVKDSAKKAGC